MERTQDTYREEWVSQGARDGGRYTEWESYSGNRRFFEGGSRKVRSQGFAESCNFVLIMSERPGMEKL